VALPGLERRGPSAEESCSTSVTSSDSDTSGVCVEEQPEGSVVEGGSALVEGRKVESAVAERLEDAAARWREGADARVLRRELLALLADLEAP
jgi:hypothetical protein